METVCVKDLSRFGRNYLKVGFYTEILFPEKGVRFIAINNGVDSAKPTENDFTPFLNIMNEWYAKDTSNKIRAIFRSRMQDGKRYSGAIPYGYRRDPEDKNHLLIIRQMAEDEGVNESMKAADQFLWIRSMNSIRNQAEDIVKHEMIYV